MRLRSIQLTPPIAFLSLGVVLLAEDEGHSTNLQRGVWVGAGLVLFGLYPWFLRNQEARIARLERAVSGRDEEDASPPCH